jgi:hypothetical protein
MRAKFGTDNAAPCWSCDGTIASYTVDDTVSLVDVYCHGCHRRDLFTRPDVAPPETAAECSAMHRGSR